MKQTQLFAGKVFTSLSFILLFHACSFSQVKPDVILQTVYGDIKIKLYDETPGHKANFLKHAKSGYYDGTTFHRIIKEFMIQGGDPNTKVEATRAQGGMGGPGYTQPAEINAKCLHKKGALAAARTGDQMNPNRESSGSQFYLVVGKKFSDAELDGTEHQISGDMENTKFRGWLAKPEQAWVKAMDIAQLQRENPDSVHKLNQQLAAQFYAQNPPTPFKYTPEQREYYKTIGGTPHLDMQYTVFGEIIEGMEVLDKLGALETLPGDRPRTDVVMKVIVP